MIPGKSLLIQQDYNHAWHPYIHLSMEVLRPAFEVVVPSEHASRFYFYKEQASASLIKEAILLDFDAAQVNEMFERVIREADTKNKLLMRITNVQALRSYGYHDDADRRAADIFKDHDLNVLGGWSKILAPDG